MLDPRRLRVLSEVAERGTLAAAAAALDYTPSAVSQQIAALERDVETVLVDRGPRGAALTEAGRVLARHAERILAGMDAATADVHALTGLRSGLLRLGWFSTAGATLMPRAIAAFRARHPDVDLGLIEADPDECAQRLRDGELELALVYEFELVEWDARNLRQHDLLVDRLRVVLPPDHPLAERRRLRLADLRDEPWVQGVRHGSTAAILPSACRAAGFEPRIAFRTDDHLAMQGLVAAGVGVGLIPEMALPNARPDIATRPLERPALVRRVRAALPPGRYESPAALAMIGVLHEVAAGLALKPAQRPAGGSTRRRPDR